MANLNKVMIMGNLTRDIELRYTPTGTAVADLGLATNRYRTADNGEKIVDVTYVDVTLWGRQAELANQYLGKGKPVFIEGRLQTDSWTDKETGKQRSKMKVVGETMQFIGAPSGGGGNSSGGNNNGGQQQQQNQPVQNSPQQAAPQQQSPPQGGSPANNMPDFQEEDDDIPF
jgi:single-strand DNA-binding protein